ncbi:MAG TPA: DUF2207 domain-containing protein [Terriglobia bacterium]|nr:DUF2207 domain-containing protein [Terriglobia bacterium]
MLKLRSSPAALCFTILAGVFPPVLFAQQPVPLPPSSDQILSYDSDITANPDSTLLVRETITTSPPALGIKHRIHRDMLTHYNDRFGNPYAIHFEVVSVQCNGQTQESRLRKISNGLRIYLGNGGEPASGKPTYELTYTVDRAIAFAPDHDELYWNVTGNGWELPIQKASATIHLPRGIAAQAIMPDAYTGREGSAQADYAVSGEGQGNITFHTTRALGPTEGLTVVVRWPKGFVHPPTDDQKYHYFLEDNQSNLIGLAGLIVLLIYYTVVWFRAGRDAKRGVLAPKPEPPSGFSPAAVRYLWRMAFDPKTLAANLVDLAVKKELAILEDGTGSYILGRLRRVAPPAPARPGLHGEARPPITADEKLLLDKLFAVRETIRLEPANRALLGKTVAAFHYHLRWNLEKVYLMANGRYLVPGLLLALATAVRCAMSIQGGQVLLVLLVTFGILLWSLTFLTFSALAIATWRNALSGPQHGPAARRNALIMGAVCLLLLVGETAGLGTLAWAASMELMLIVAIMILLNYLFHGLLKAPSRSGRKLLDDIEGFRMFLATAEMDRRDIRSPLKATPALFEKFLPYAMALNVEKAWNERFAAVLIPHGQGTTRRYNPEWYSGPAWDPVIPANFATSLANSFSSAIATSIKSLGRKRPAAA